MKLRPQQIEAVLALPAPKRYSHFIKVVVDQEKVWGLYQDGWALSCTDEGQTTSPFWPAREYAQLCALEEWSGYEPKSISLDDLLDVVLPQLKRENILPAVFPKPEGPAIHQGVDELLQDLREELRRYE